MSTDPTLQAISSWLPKQPKPLTDRQTDQAFQNYEGYGIIGEDRNYFSEAVECIPDVYDADSYIGPYTQHYDVGANPSTASSVSYTEIGATDSGVQFSQQNRLAEAAYRDEVIRRARQNRLHDLSPTYVIIDEMRFLAPSADGSHWATMEDVYRAERNINAQMNPEVLNYVQNPQEVQGVDRDPAAWVIEQGPTNNYARVPVTNPPPQPNRISNPPNKWRKLRIAAIREMRFGQREQEAIANVILPYAQAEVIRLAYDNHHTADYTLIIPNEFRILNNAKICGLDIVTADVDEIYIARKARSN